MEIRDGIKFGIGFFLANQVVNYFTPTAVKAGADKITEKLETVQSNLNQIKDALDDKKKK